MSENLPSKRKYGVPQFRDRIIRRLETAYAENKFDLEEYEKRLDLAYRAEFIEDLEILVHDFPPQQQPGRIDLPDENSEGDGDTKIAVLGDKHLTAEDFKDKRLQILSIVGDVNIDIRGFRHVVEPIHIKVHSFLGDTRVIIPRGMKVKNRFKSLIGDYELVRNESPEGSPEGSLEEQRGICVLEGFSVLGDVSIQEEGSRKKGFLQKFFQGWRNRG
ncbi:MAG: DUF1707 and DUF2154 domain-containing protein [Spirochaetales bacterium]|nr:DUF1707 and DUF2154 domain-containing protein [Spirochaetales bacterium]